MEKVIMTVMVLACIAMMVQAEEQALERLKLALPKAKYIGTPKDLTSPNLEPPGRDSLPELMAPKGVSNLAKDKPVTSSHVSPVIGDLTVVTDGDKEAQDGSYVEIKPGKQWVQIDLGKSYSIYAIALWHYHTEARIYRDVIVQVCDDAEFMKDVKIVFNNDHDNSSGLGVGKEKEYVESNKGRLIDVKGVTGRYVRCYSNGSTAGEVNHYTEVEVYGK